MTGYVAILRRELAGLFVQPLAWALLCVALLLQGAFFSAAIGAREFGGDTAAALRFALGGGFGFWALVLVLPPLVTMRMISEEARSGLLEFLLTAPIRDGALVLGKATAATVFFAAVWAAAPIYAIALAVLGVPVDWASVIWGYVGAVVVSGLFCAAGLFASALSSTPALAAFISFAFGLLFLAVPRLGLLDAWLDPRTAREVFDTFDVLGRYQASFLRGAVDSSHLAFFAAWITLFLFLATRVLEMRRWR